MPNLEIFFGFMVLLSVAVPGGSTRSRETLLQEADKYGEQAIEQFVGELLRIRSHKSSTKRAGL